MLLVAGTVPDDDFPLTIGMPEVQGEKLVLEGLETDVNRGTPALVAAALATARFLGDVQVSAILVGDTGLGHGSRELYALLSDGFDYSKVSSVAFHYLQPDVDWHNKVLFKLQSLNPRPKLMADAGFMYAAKMSGMAGEYDLFTPDVGELAFLADEQAPHPFYTRGFILQRDDKTQEYIELAYHHDNAAKTLLVKGKQDLIASREGILHIVDHPSHPAMEAIGGTGDTITGMAAVLVESGYAEDAAGAMAAKANRIAASMANPDPSTQIAEIIRHLPEALAQAVVAQEQS